MGKLRRHGHGQYNECDGNSQAYNYSRDTDRIFKCWRYYVTVSFTCIIIIILLSTWKINISYVCSSTFWKHKQKTRNMSYKNIFMNAYWWRLRLLLYLMDFSTSYCPELRDVPNIMEYRYNEESSKCQRLQWRGTCGNNMIFYLKNGIYGECGCKTSKRILVPDTSSKECYALFTQASEVPINFTRYELINQIIRILIFSTV